MKKMTQMFKDVSKGLVVGALLGFAVFAAFEPQVAARAISLTLTPSLWVGNRSATPGQTVSEANESAFVEGTLEVDGVLYADGGISGGVSGGAVSATTLAASGASTLNGAWTLGDADGDQGAIESSSITVASSAPLKFSTGTAGSGTILLSMDVAGKTGIGTAAPETTFQVVGGCSRLGTGSTPGVTCAADDLFVEDSIEADGVLNVGGAATILGATNLGDAEADTVTLAAPAKLYSRTMAQLASALSGQVAGMVVWCSDCDTTGAVCHSTHTAAGSWVNSKDNTTSCD